MKPCKSGSVAKNSNKPGRKNKNGNTANYKQNSIVTPKEAEADVQKFKTEMCKNWIEFGYCRYGKKCQYAHGEHELHETQELVHHKYKSKLCKSFHTKNFCPYGLRCQFKHDSREFEQVHNFAYKYRVQVLPEQYLDALSQPETHSRRLSAFANLKLEEEEEQQPAEPVLFFNIKNSPEEFKSLWSFDAATEGSESTASDSEEVSEDEFDAGEFSALTDLLCEFA